jgi:NAD+ diphosphatase
MARQTGERAMVCPACGFTAYPRIAPAMMVLVRRGDRILLGRAPHFLPEVYSALAGFVEAGESLEECVHREVLEEVGITVANLRYFRSQSWPFPHSLMLAFIADYAAGELRPDPAELSDARWFAVDELPRLPNRISISRALIDAVVADIRGYRG